MVALDFLKNVGQGIGGGIKKVGQGILPKGPDPLMRTPGFVPEGAAKTAAVFQPAAAMPAPSVPALPSGPSLPDTSPTFGRGIVPNMPRPTATPASLAGMNPPTPIPVQPGNLGGRLEQTRAPLPMPDIPQLPGHEGSPIPDNPIDRARRDFVMRGAKRNPDGTLPADDEIQFKRSGKDIFMSSLVGASTGMKATGSPWGALGGAMAGAGGSAISPQRGREMLFNEQELPQLEEQRNRQQEEQKLQDEAFRRESERVRMEQDALMGRERIAGIQAQAEADRARAEDLRREKFRDAPWGTYSERTGNVNYERSAGAGTPARPQGLMNTREGIYDPASRQWLERFDTSKPPSEADRRADERQRAAAMKDSQAFLVKFNDLKNDLLKTEANLSDPEVQQNPALYQSYAAQAATMKAQLADLAQFANDNYGDTLEGGPGQGGYAYVKPRPGGRAAMPRTGGGGGQKGTVGPEYVNFIAESLKVPPDEARRRLEADGYKVRQ